MRLIDADALKAIRFHDLPYSQIVPTDCDTDEEVYAYKSGWNDAIDAIVESVPTVDPVKHGHWTIEDMVTYERSYGGTLYEPVYKCSCCGRVTESYVRGDEPIMPEDADFPKFCGNCGAKMDEVEHDT